MRFLIAFILTSLQLSVWAQEALPVGGFLKAKESLLNSENLQGASFSWCLRDVYTGQVMDQYQQDLQLVPASTLKLITTGVGLSVLGNNFRYKTEFFIRGDIQGNELKGDFLVFGSGDPSFGSGVAGSNTANEVLGSIKQMLQDAGIKKITGSIIIDPTYFANDQTVIPRDWVWEDIGNYYGAGAFGLNWRSNSFSVSFTPSAIAGKVAAISNPTPELYGVSFENNVETDSTPNEDIYLFSAPFSTRIFASGKMSPKGAVKTERGAIPNPPFQFGSELIVYLEKENINVSKGFSIALNTIPVSEKWIRAGAIFSPTLLELSTEINQNSNNLFAQCVYKTLQKTSGNTSVMEDFISTNLGIKNGFNFTDGCGLSRTNLITTSVHTQFLSWYFKRDSVGFISTLPLAGYTGTMRNFARVPRLYIKSGSLGKVRTYAGYMRDKSGRIMSFSLLFNNFPGSGASIRNLAAHFFTEASGYSFLEPLKYAGFDSLKDSIRSTNEFRKAFQVGEENEILCAPNLELKSTPSHEDPFFYARYFPPAGCDRKTELRFRIHVTTRAIEVYDAENQWYSKAHLQEEEEHHWFQFDKHQRKKRTD